MVDKAVMIRSLVFGLVVASLALSSASVWCREGTEGAARADLVDVPPIPLRAVRTTPLGSGDFAWLGQPRCDDDGSVVFLRFHPPARESGTPAAREVLRVSRDGEQTRFQLEAIPGFDDAVEISPMGLAVDARGWIHLIVWVEHGYRNGDQCLVSFDPAGRYRATRQGAWPAMRVSQMEVFESGDFLLRGRRLDENVERLSVLSRDGSLDDMIGWPSGPWPPTLHFMVRGGDDRIYVLDRDRLERENVVYGVLPSGEIAEAVRLPATPSDRSLDGLRASGGRLAVAYREATGEGDRRGRRWVAIYSDVAGDAELRDVYGPGPGSLLCYAREDAQDRFTFLGSSGSRGLALVAMVPDPARQSLVARGPDF